MKSGRAGIKKLSHEAVVCVSLCGQAILPIVLGIAEGGDF